MVLLALLDGFALGVPVMLADFPRKHTAFALVFCALMTPLGILIGMAATETVRGASGQLSKAVIISMSSGSFIFISLVELLPAGLSNGKHLLPKMAVVFLGWGAMALLALWV